MPSAEPWLQDEMMKRFGTLDDGPPCRFLEDAGYTPTRDHFWLPKPGVTSLDDMTSDEFACLAFLVGEWDMGTLRLDGNPPREA